MGHTLTRPKRRALLTTGITFLPTMTTQPSRDWPLRSVPKPKTREEWEALGKKHAGVEAVMNGWQCPTYDTMRAKTIANQKAALAAGQQVYHVFWETWVGRANEARRNSILPKSRQWSTPPAKRVRVAAAAEDPIDDDDEYLKVLEKLSKPPAKRVRVAAAAAEEPIDDKDDWLEILENLSQQDVDLPPTNDAASINALETTLASWAQ